MPAIGNDRKRYVAADAHKGASFGKSGWMRGKAAQIMVLFNGLVLTLTAFLTLNIFVNQTITEGVSVTFQETREYFEDEFRNVEKGLIGVKAAIKNVSSVSAPQFIESFKAGYHYKEFGDSIYWMEQVNEGQYSIHRLTDPANGNNDGQNNASLYRYVAATVDKKKEGVQFFAANPEFEKKDNTNSEAFILAVIASKSNGAQDIVFTLTSLDKIVTNSFFQKRKNLHDLSVLWGTKEVKLFTYSDGENLSDKDLPYANTFPLLLGEEAIGLHIRAKLTSREFFLNKIPYLLLFFGMILTFIGTLYVRSNQRQSLRLASINMELAQKNIDLNKEIAEREKLNQALHRAEKENRAVIDAVSDIIFETSTDGQILFLNETWQKVTGFAVDRSIGRNIFDLLYMQDQTEQRSNFAQLVKGKKQGYRAFTRLRNADGNFRSVELAVSMLRLDENKELRVVGTITDVEERRRTERALSEAEKKYRAIVENAASGIYQVTPEGHYLSANPALAVILGYGSAEEILREVRNANTEIYYNGRERERELREAVRSGNVTVECQVRKKDGDIIWVQESLRAVKDDNDQLIYFEGSMDDVTQRKETEIALRAAKVDSDLANRAKSEFLANMSHELRTPLNAIIGFSDIIRNQAFGEVGRSEYLDYARDINEGGKRLLQVINDILDVSRIEAGERQLNESMVDLNRVVHSTLDMLGPKIEANSMIVDNYIDTHTPKLIGETHAIKQMLVNLLSNAVKFTPSGGRISIKADVDDFGQMNVSVTDTGIGLTDEEIEKALSPFGQVNTAFSKSESGMGLGLTLVQSLMTLHGGSFELFSQKGIGTTATLIFPPKRVSLSPVKTPEKV